jgi:hypothetical protein
MTTATVVPIRREFQVHRFDPIKHGVLSRHIALPWEDREAFEEILRGLLIEHQPQGPTAYHLVEDLAGVIWRKRRLLQAEGAALRRRLHGVATGYDNEKVASAALAHTGATFHGRVADVVANRLPKSEDTKCDLALIEEALGAAQSGKRGAYQTALRLLDEDTQAAFQEEVVDPDSPEDGGYSRDAEGLGEFLEANRDWLRQRIEDTANAPLVTEQVHGTAIDIRDLERIAKIEAHLDAKMQKLLGLLNARKPLKQT